MSGSIRASRSRMAARALPFDPEGGDDAFAGQPARRTGRFRPVFREDYNLRRPHEALGQTVPASHYRSSPRGRCRPALPSRITPTTRIIRRVRSNGEIKWRGELVYVAGLLAVNLSL